MVTFLSSFAAALGLAAAGQAPRTPMIDLPAFEVVEPDTVRPVRFEIPAGPLAEALAEFERQAAIRVRVDVELFTGGDRARRVSGVHTPPEALRLLLGGTSLTATFADERTAHVTSGALSVAYALTPVSVVVQRGRGYAAGETVTAMRTETSLLDTPQTVSVVTHEVIADQAMQGMADLVRYVPGVSMGQGEGHRDAPTIRAISTTADFFTDGIRDDAQYYRDLYNAERVEALKGSNALVFGRGGGGGVLNRVSKEAQWAPVHAVSLQYGSHEDLRGTIDLGAGLTNGFAARFNGMYERAEGFRDRMELERFGVNPTVAWLAGSTTVRASAEVFDDWRRVDRGLPSFEGRPLDVDVGRFFGNPDLSFSTLRMNAVGASVEHRLRGITFRNRTRVVAYEKFYQNSYPGSAVSGDGMQVNLAAYNSATGRRNVFNQTDVVVPVSTGRLEHTLLIGAELGRQRSDNRRLTGYYEDAATSLPVPVASPTVTTPITFRPSASDADNRGVARTGSLLAQDQIRLGTRWEVVVGLRFDRFTLDFENHRNSETLERTDHMVSPRAGLIFKPTPSSSLYGSYSVSYLPSSGEQFASLTATTSALEPERFANYELGGKWDVRPRLSLTAAAYRLDRTNTTAPDPVDPARLVQTGAQRATGLELGLAGRVSSAWEVLGGVTAQKAEIVRRTTAAPEGAIVPLVPEFAVSLWNRYQLLPAVGIGVGAVHQTEMYAAIDNSVTLPGFTRFDAALFFDVGSYLTAQVNVENLFDTRYYPTSHGNNNIMPGAPRSFRVVLSTGR